ncbi:FAD-containing oxidoreductase [Phyllobacterium sp. 0TCS1.6C]|uniref:FAD-containing oxidoreductase n=1 Tax=unclassified Phyllobacterium TaxID=2638441 RepID=UPI002263ACCB|nr:MULTISPECIES: FAD-containing oxidoreductase [unclassified Phyllobacterium]MCX8281878.1 FAD-containing oxidoreductase [Phyllobacterium sp. 0TCS1.6C]MCX8295413.1 FAD-containing oxidoreductase [Phyllobacterium sp. 0TCS1.6A]
MKTFDAIIIGAGQAGPSLAGRLTAAGKTVLLVERKLFGGTCVNTGCMPTKALVASAYAAHLARRGSDFGVTIDSPIRIDMARIRERAATVTQNARSGVENWLKGMERCTVVEGHARFAGPNEIEIDGERYGAPNIFINAGGRANIPDMPGIDQIDYLTNRGILELDHLPEHLVIIGGSYIGLEFAQMYRRFGAEVTIVEKGPRLISREDEDISEAIRQILEKEGIRCVLNAECISFRKADNGIEVGLDCDETSNVVGTHVLMAVGRRPNTDDLGLDKAGVETDARGYIKVDDRLATNVPGIWALGDCNGRGAFTHTSYNDYEIVAANLLDGGDRRLSDRIMGYALYIDPPLGRVGMSENEARKSGRPLLVSTRPMSRVGRAVEKDETQGFMRVIADAQTRRILGAAILGTGGDEAIHGILDMMNADADISTLQWAVPIHPTVSELIPTLIGDLKPADRQ